MIGNIQFLERAAIFFKRDFCRLIWQFNFTMYLSTRMRNVSNSLRIDISEAHPFPEHNKRENPDKQANNPVKRTHLNSNLN
jgi:hypothetical protein